MSKPSVLVTGGAGFIGSNIVDALLDDGGFRVRVLDNFATGLRSNLQHCKADIEMVEGDIRDVETVEMAVEGIDCILHQAALPSVPRSVRAPNTSNEVNVGGTLKLLTAAHNAGVKRLVFASSSSVYGDSDVMPKDESMTPNPKSPYAVTKITGEYYVRVFASLYGMQTASLRYFNVFGPRQDPTSQYSGVIAKFISAALNSEPFVVYGDGQQARDFTYVDNVVRANVAALKADHLDGVVMNVACGGQVSLLEMIEELRGITGTVGELRFAEPRAGDVKFSQAAIEVARKTLGYEPSVSFREGLERTVEWYRTNESAR